MEPSRTDAPHAARRDEHAARAVLLHQHCFTCDPAGMHFVTCSTFRHLQHFLHLQHVFTCDPPTLHVLPAVLHRSCHPPSCASYRPSCDCSTCGPPTSACCTCTAPALSSSAQRHLQHAGSTAPPDTTQMLCACVFLSVPRQMRLVLSTFGTEVSSLPRCCTPRNGAAAPAAGDRCCMMLVRNASGCCCCCCQF